MPLTEQERTRVGTSKCTIRALQCMVALGGLVPVLAGLMGAAMGPNMVDDTLSKSVTLDSHYRYLSGLLIGIGFCFWSTIPHIETKKSTFQFLTFIVFIGGLARLYSLLTIGVPEPGMIFGLGMELCVVPLLAFWQSKIAHNEVLRS